MEAAIAIFPYVLMAFLVSAFLTYIFVLPLLPGTVIPKSPRNFVLAFLASLVQTISTGGILLSIGVPALYIGVIIVTGKGLTSMPFWIGASFGLLISLCSVITFGCLKFAEPPSHHTIEFNKKSSRPLSALTLTLAQVLSGFAVLVYAENAPPPQQTAALPPLMDSVIPRTPWNMAMALLTAIVQTVSTAFFTLLLNGPLMVEGCDPQMWFEITLALSMAASTIVSYLYMAICDRETKPTAPDLEPQTEFFAMPKPDFSNTICNAEN